MQRRRRKLDFAARFERGIEPLCTIDLVPQGESDAHGLLWVQPHATFGTSDNRNASVYLRGMLLDDDARDLLPRWAGFVGAAIESSRLVPTASREDLQRDGHWRAVAQAVSEQLITGLSAIAAAQPEAWRRVLLRHNEALLGASLTDPRLFALLADALTVPTSEGDLRVRDVVVRSKGTIYLSIGEHGGFEENVFRAMKVPIATGIRYAVLPFLHRYGSERGVPVVELGTARGDRHVFSPAAASETDRAWLQSHLAGPKETVVTARFAPASMPLVVVPDREVELKERIEADEADRRIATAALRLARTHTASIDGTVAARVYVNLDNPAVHALLASDRRDDARTALLLLRALKGLVAGQGSATGLDEALDMFTSAVVDTVGGGA